ncbi:MAG: ATP-binding protein [Bacteriovoracia bacterium]
MWIKREIAKFIEQNEDAIQVVRGPRQCGKSSLLLKLDSDFHEVSLDDPSLRELAQSDPELFLRQFGAKKLFIDEAQYAPNLFPSLKRRADLFKRDSKNRPQAILRITGSNQILMDKNIKESLAGRASFFDMNTLSISEILNAENKSIQDILYTGGWPELHATKKDPKKFLDDYINTYIEKDIVLTAGIQKSREFLKFVRLLAGRVGEILDLSSFSNEVGVDSKTIKDWISVLEKMHVIALVMPFSSNLSSRLIKSPKVYFIDTGLACRLQGWTSATPIMTSPQQGHLFENLVFSEIFKLNINYQLGYNIYHWRSRDGEEVDFLIQKDPNNFQFIEAKVSSTNPKDLAIFPEVRKVFKREIPELIVCHQEGDMVLNRKIPIAKLSRYLEPDLYLG